MKREAKYNLCESSCRKIKVKLQLGSMVILSPVSLLPFVSLSDPARSILLIVTVRDTASCVHTGLRYLYHWYHMARKITSALGRRMKTDQLLDWGNWCNWGMWRTHGPSSGQQIYLRTVIIHMANNGVRSYWTTLLRARAHTHTYTNSIYILVFICQQKICSDCLCWLCDESLITPRRWTFLAKQNNSSEIESCLRR